MAIPFFWFGDVTLLSGGGGVGCVCHGELLEVVEGRWEGRFFYWVCGVTVAPGIVVVKVNSSFFVEPGIKDLY